MSGIKFETWYFLRTVIIFLLLSATWTTLCIFFNEFTDRDKGFLTGLGFLLVLAVTIFFGQQRKSVFSFWLLTAVTIAMFLVGSFVLGPLIGLTTDSMIIYAITNALFVAVVMTLVLNKIYFIEFRLFTILLTFVSLLLSYFLIEKYSEQFQLDYNIQPRIIMFNVFQLLLIIPLSVGIASRKAGK